MTNSEAIRALNHIRGAIRNGLPPTEPGKAIEGIDLAIAALERDKWRMIQTRPMDDDERKEWSERLGYDIEYEEAVIYTGLPDDGQEVLVYKHPWGGISIDKFESDPDYGCSFEENGDMDGIVAWMPLPEPPKEEP